ncbi:ER lumen protein retaining receptor, partial [Teladorsagia circumcincta]
APRLMWRVLRHFGDVAGDRAQFQLLSIAHSLISYQDQVFFLATSIGTVYLMWIKFKATYDRNNDSLRIEFLVIPAAILALLVNHEFTFMEIMWTFSIYLESVAIMPQLFMLSRTGNAETITAHYLFALGSYRALYIVNWVFRYYTENFFDPIAVVAGIVQTVLYADFFYLYVTRDHEGRRDGPRQWVYKK